jgi:hypothetical protein
MALTVEDGTGLADADSYLSEANADSYHSARGNTTWAAATSPNKEIALRLATEYIDQRFTFKGVKKTTTQSLQWPRISACGGSLDPALDPKIDLVPVAVEKAVAEYALRQLSDPLMTDPTVDESGRRIKKESTEIGGAIVESKEYSEYSSPSAFKPYPKADTFLKYLIVGGVQQELLRG